MKNRLQRYYQEKGGYIMKFLKGVLFGTAISASVWMLCSEDTKCKRNKMMKQGKKFMRSMGMM